MKEKEVLEATIMIERILTHGINLGDLTELEAENYFLDLANQSNEGYVSEHGEIERWKGGIDKDKISIDITKAAQEARKNIQKELTNEKN